ncbi:MAG: PAS domain S-box protein [Magnetococcales bacterium]|nr:PAS domain S-box protein [Magnetococcales bacterium]
MEEPELNHSYGAAVQSNLLETEGTRISAMAKSQVRFIVALHDNKNMVKEAPPEEDLKIFLALLANAYQGWHEGLGATGEITFARRQGEQIEYLFRQRDADTTLPRLIPWDTQVDVAIPMRRALQGGSGTVIDLDYRGVLVLAAYEFIAPLNLGLVVKIDLAELRAPMLEAIEKSVAFTLLFLLAGGMFFNRTSEGVIRKVQESEQRLKLSESRFRGAFETAAHGMALISPQGRFLQVNQSLCRMVGYGEEELLSVNFQTITHPDDLETDLAHMSPLLAGTIASYQTEKRYFHRDGHIIWVLLSVSMVRDGDGQPLHFVSQIQDITARKTAEEGLLVAREQLELQKELQKSNHFLERLFNTTHVSIVFLDADFNFIRVNRSYADACSLDVDFFPGKNHFALYPGEEVEAIFRRVVETGEPFSIIARPFDFPDHPEWGTTYWDWTLTPIKDGQERVEWLIFVLRDVTKSKRIELALMEAHLEVKRQRDNLEALLVDRTQMAEALREQRDQLEHQVEKRTADLAGKNRLFEIIKRMQDKFINEPDCLGMFDLLLQDITALTGSEYGLVGEVLQDESEVGYLKINALTIGPDWNEETHRFCAENRTNGLVFKKLDNLLGRVVTDRAPVMANDLPHHPQRAGFPSGHPAIASFLGIPVFYGDRLVGEIGLANRPDGYDQALLDYLYPVVDACGRIIVARWDRQARLDTEHELVLARDAADAANCAKSAFLATMSHEIRTPMNGVLGMADLVLRTSLTERQRHYIETIHRSGRTLLRIINDILDLSKIQAGRMIMDIIQFDLGDVVQDVNEFLASQAKAKGLVLNCKIADGVPVHLLGDPYRINQILLNLVGNAVKFTAEGTVDVVVDVMEQREADVLLRFQITDTGIGISSEFQSRLFQEFSQEDPSFSRKFGGTGLGLAIAQRLVVIMGGELGVKSVPDQGSIFWFTARFGRQQPGDRREIADLKSVQRLALLDNVQFNGRVLLVEDNLINQEVAVATLEMFGCQVTVAGNGHQAMEAVHEATEPFDIVLMDCEMPVLNGFETTRRLRQWEIQAGHPRTPIIALTAHVLQQHRQQCSEAGMDDFLTKPFSQADLGGMLNRWLPQAGGDADGNEPTNPLSLSPSQNMALVFLPPLSPSREEGNGDVVSSLPVLDQTALDHILALTRKGGTDLLSKMVEHYLARTPELLAELEQALAQNDSEGVRIAAHTLKSSCLTMGATRLAELGRAMEADCSDLTTVHQHFRLSGPAFAESAQALSDLCASQKKEGTPSASIVSL